MLPVRSHRGVHMVSDEEADDGGIMVLLQTLLFNTGSGVLTALAITHRIHWWAALLIGLWGVCLLFVGYGSGYGSGLKRKISNDEVTR